MWTRIITGLPKLFYLKTDSDQLTELLECKQNSTIRNVIQTHSAVHLGKTSWMEVSVATAGWHVLEVASAPYQTQTALASSTEASLQDVANSPTAKYHWKLTWNGDEDTTEGEEGRKSMRNKRGSIKVRESSSRKFSVAEQIFLAACGEGHTRADIPCSPQRAPCHSRWIFLRELPLVESPCWRKIF